MDDPRTGLCVDTAPSGAKIGALCDTDHQCAGGLCLETATGRSACTAICIFGELGCGYDDVTDVRGALCVRPYLRTAAGEEGVDDIGLCAQLCDVTSDCSHPDAFCQLDPQVPGRAGYCNFPKAPSPDAGAAP